MTDVHSTAIVSPEARLHDGVQVGPYATIGMDHRSATVFMSEVPVLSSGRGFPPCLRIAADRHRAAGLERDTCTAAMEQKSKSAPTPIQAIFRSLEPRTLADGPE